MEGKSLPAFGLVVNQRNEILLIQRGYGKDKGKWSLPGGMRDKGETYRDTAVRETREETGIRMSADELYYRGTRSRFEVWRGKRIGGRLRVQRKECLDAKWFQFDMLPHDEDLAFGPDKRAIGKWAAANPGSRRVHYPRSKMVKSGFALVVNDRNEILLIRRTRGPRARKWSLPGGNAIRGRGRRDTAVHETQRATGIRFVPDRLYYENRHDARIWLGKPSSLVIQLGPLTFPMRKENAPAANPNSHWFPLDHLPDDDSLGFAIDVRTIEKWASENEGSRRTEPLVRD